LKNIFEIPTPPAVRVVSVGALRSIETSIDLEEFPDYTLAEVQHVASHMVDEGVEVLVSIVVETDTRRVTGQAEVPFEWFDRQIRMRSILNFPNDGEAVLNNSDEKSLVASPRRKTKEDQLINFGRYLTQSWTKRRRPTDLLALATSSWIDLVKNHDTEAALSTSDEMSFLLASGMWTKAERRRLAKFCTSITSRLQRA
jgi:hypothetical protein